MKYKSKLNLRRLGLLALLAGLTGSAGCSWESELYKNYAENGVTPCPGLQYIDNGEVKFFCDEDGCYTYCETCPLDKECDDKDKCLNSDTDTKYDNYKDNYKNNRNVHFEKETDEYKKYIDAFTYGICPNDFSVCDDSEVNNIYCRTLKGCQSLSDCEKTITNWADGKCEDNKCIVKSCDNGYRPSEDELSCVPNCGNNGYYDDSQSKCVNSTIHACSSSTNDCTTQKGWLDGEENTKCEDNVCKAINCDNGYKPSENGLSCDPNCGNNGYYDDSQSKCVNSTIHACGSGTNDCTQLLGWANGACENNTCIATDCIDGYDLKAGQCQSSADSCNENQYYNLTQKRCEDHNLENCGNFGKKCADIQGWANGICTSQGVCEADTCLTGYHLDGTNCVADTNEACGENAIDCETKTTGKFCSEGQCTNACTGGLLTCTVDGQYICANTGSDMQHCGGCNAACTATKVSNSATAICRNSQCVAESCKLGYHLNGNICKVDSPENCGQVGRNCSTIVSGWSAGTCDKGVCKATTCSTGYYLDGSTCVADSNTNCGKKDNACKAGTFCSEGQCTDACTGGLQNCSGYCANTGSDMQHCGGCNIACTATKVLNSATAICRNSQCVAESCKLGYHLDGNICEVDSPQNCGQVGRSCSTIVSGWSAGTCDKGVCKASTCSTGYYLDGSTCVADSNTNCGKKGNACKAGTFCSEGQCTDACTGGLQNCSGYCANTGSDMQHCGGCNIACTTDKVSKSTAVTCTAKGCAPISCATGYYPDGTICKQYDVNNCGAKGASCKSQIPGFKTGTCTTNGVCQAATCEDNYIPVSGICLVNCTQNQYWHNGKCVDSDVENCGSETNDCTDIAGFKTDMSGENYQYIQCVNNQCKAITECDDNYHFVKDSGQDYGTCELDTKEKCGSETNDCTAIAHVIEDSVACMDGVCKVYGCNAGYVPNEEQTGCKAVACASNDDCKDKIAHADDDNYGVACFGNVCKVTSCLTGYVPNSEKTACICASGYHLNNDSSCVADSKTACGSTSVDCTDISHAVNVECVNAECQVNSCDGNYEPHSNNKGCVCKTGYTGTNCDECITGYHKNNDNSCVVDSKTACGSTTVDCTAISHADDVECLNAECQVNSCDGNYVPDSNNKACVCKTGYKGTNCDECDTGYHMDNGSCVKDSLTACGSVDNNCTAIDHVDATNVSCDAGKCIVAACTGEYAPDSENAACIKCADESKVPNGTNTACVECTSANYTYCGEYKCKSDNTCRTSCSKNTHCATGYSCIGNECVKL